MKGHYNVLFLCTRNSARSILAEAILNFKGRPTFTAFSAGSHPTGTVRREALRQLEQAHIPVKGLRSKSWEEFSGPGAASSISSSLSVTTRQTKSVQSGLGSL
jgi:arsenate reductase